jgi:hypothetical protein
MSIRKQNATCSQCSLGKIVDRKPRNSSTPVIHYGFAASGHQVMRHGATRDQPRRELDVLCFKMGAMEDGEPPRKLSIHYKVSPSGSG